MAVGIYIRVSTEEQVREGFSISAQREKLKAFCEVHDWTEYKFYVDEGISAKDTNRPQLELMLQHIEQGSIDTVLVYRLDRLTRSVVDMYKLLDIFEKNNCTFKSATEVYDTGSAIGRLFITLVASMAQWERENLGERVRMGQIEKARQGEYSAKAPYGFDKVDGRLVINDKEKEVVLDMIEKIKGGYSIRRLADHLDLTTKPIRGYKWHIRTILNILQNHALYGAVRWLDEIIDGAHEGIITKEEFESLQKLISNRQNFKKRDTTSIFIYQMKLICPTCGSRLTSERSRWKRKKDKEEIVHNRYRCQVCALNKRKSISTSEKKMEKALLDYMEEITFDRVPKPEIKSDINNEIDMYNKQLQQIDRQREKYQKAWSLDQMTDEEFAKRMDETKRSRDEIKKKLESIQPSSNDDIDFEKVKQIATDIKLNWSYLTSEEKKQFLNNFIESIEFEVEGSTPRIKRVRFY